tara:strand:- start:448 stop:609 length:162 start_codon:yes stop_codon:yes gene_type:complete
MAEDWSRWVKTQGSKCRGCYTTTGIYYCLTDHKGNKWESCVKCVDKLREMRDG